MDGLWDLRKYSRIERKIHHFEVTNLDQGPVKLAVPSIPPITASWRQIEIRS